MSTALRQAQSDALCEQSGCACRSLVSRKVASTISKRVFKKNIKNLLNLNHLPSIKNIPLQHVVKLTNHI